jgi:hypothetical protein
LASFLLGKLTGSGACYGVVNGIYLVAVKLAGAVGRQRA